MELGPSLRWLLLQLEGCQPDPGLSASGLEALGRAYAARHGGARRLLVKATSGAGAGGGGGVWLDNTRSVLSGQY